VRNPLPGYCHETAGAVALLTEAIDTLEIDEAALAASAARNWSTTSALADDLVEARGLSYRAAHEIVARLVTAHENVGSGERLRADLVAEHLAGYSLERVAELLDPWTFVHTRTSSGGTAEARRKELTTLAYEDLSRHRRHVAELESSVEDAMALLVADARALLDE
jgi:argininosuccinate lyase